MDARIQAMFDDAVRPLAAAVNGLPPETRAALCDAVQRIGTSMGMLPGGFLKAHQSEIGRVMLLVKTYTDGQAYALRSAITQIPELAALLASRG